MEIEDVRYEDTSKFMWDGKIYESREEMKIREKEYEEHNFEVRHFEQEGKYLLYTRRVVKEIILDGPPPA